VPADLSAARFPESKPPAYHLNGIAVVVALLTLMNLLYKYSKQYWKLFAVALLLAATNQIFSLLDPLIFRHVIDS
jgi:hypothetical protein